MSWPIALIPLLRGGYTTIDSRDFDRLSRFRWRLSCEGYAMTSYRTEGGIQTATFMHRIIAGVLPGEYVDHINGDRLDNRRENIRVATLCQNSMNQAKQARSKSKYKGVWQRGNRWRAMIRTKNIRKSLGSFATESDAALAYNLAATELFGDFARLNVIQ